ncbi:MAG: hypothetical protein P4L03_01420 [Terracidiphilus sp.]|nr:hypothetical protein [Terracidiphilus sp.]
MNHDPDHIELLAQLDHLRSLAEKAYRDMYEAGSPSAAAACYGGARDCFCDAIGLADRLGLPGEATAMRQRLDHIESVFRSQFG